MVKIQGLDFIKIIKINLIRLGIKNSKKVVKILNLVRILNIVKILKIAIIYNFNNKMILKLKIKLKTKMI